MTKKPRHVLIPWDDLAWEQSDSRADAWERAQLNADNFRAVAKFINQHKPGKAVELHKPIRGGYNVCYRLEYDDGSSVALRVPIDRPGVKFADEKVMVEVATMRLVAEQTTIPVPKIYHYGVAADNPLGIGPFIIMDYVEHQSTMSDAMADASLAPGEDHVLDPNIEAEKLEFFYRQLANVLLQLSRLQFNKVGSLLQDGKGNISASGRPLIQNMSHLMQFTGMPDAMLPSSPYADIKSWYAALAEMHIAQFTFQHNDAILDEYDAKDKFVARLLFRQLVSEDRLVSTADGESMHQPDIRLFSEDLRPSNILLDKDLRIAGVIDWEYTYAAPAQFSDDPPWWLLLMKPEEWPGAYEPWMQAFEPRLWTFLRVLEEEEKKLETYQLSNGTQLKASTLNGMCLSKRMRKSWDDKTWMIGFAARNSWAFDLIFWRLGLLTQKQREALEDLVAVKMEERKERKLKEWEPDEAKAHLARFWG
ncbi:phosphotransferase enzyme family protein [Sarocladium implicatum]|nr:phosphotransferase enzyme family protein [Sarocladium implicatum]